jgi:hypothetical protein
VVGGLCQGHARVGFATPPTCLHSGLRYARLLPLALFRSLDDDQFIYLCLLFSDLGEWFVAPFSSWLFISAFCYCLPIWVCSWMILVFLILNLRW